MISSMPFILIVDDDDGHLLVAQRAISRSSLHAEVQAVRTGAEALHILGLNGDPSTYGNPKPAVVMLDLSMPGMSGWDVLQRIRERDRRTPVVVVSSSGRPDDVRRSYEMGANSYLVKRYEADRPGGYVADAARYWVELNENVSLP
jgi:CheY-like chemotaxis protein